MTYEETKREAQRCADETGLDHGIHFSTGIPGRGFYYFMLPQKKNRGGHELRCEVVSCTNLSTFAYHVSEVMTAEVGPQHTRENPYVLRLTAGLPEGVVTVELWHAGTTPIWDHTRVNGVDTGNRCGAREAICRIVNEFPQLKAAA